MAAIGFKKHNHAACARKTISIAEAHCKANKLQFTPTRRRVLELLLEEHRPLGAYDILQRLTEEGRGAQPSIAYRALDFLIAQGFAHKVERLNAFIACTQPGEAHMPAFMICRACNCVAEAASVPSRSPLGKAARETGFKIEQTVIEAEGLCPNCIATASAA